MEMDYGTSMDYGGLWAGQCYNNTNSIKTKNLYFYKQFVINEGILLGYLVPVLLICNV